MSTLQMETPAGSRLQRLMAGAEAGTSSRWLILVVLAAVAFMAQLDLFIVNVALPAMGNSFGSAHLGGLSWVLNAYGIVFAALLVPAGRLADHYGRRVFLLAGVATFTLASIICAFAPSLPVMVGGRVIQAVGAALIVPTSLGLLYPSFPKEQHNLVVGIWAGVAAVAAASGPTVGGLLVGIDWRLIFLVNAPIGLATIVAGTYVLPEIRAHVAAKLPDVLSGVSLFAAILLLTFATVQSSSWGWDCPATLILLAAAAVAGAVAVRRAITVPNALVEASLFRSRQFTGATLGLFLFFVGFAAWLLLTVLLFQNEWHYSALRTGLAIAPGPLSAAVFAVNAGRITGRFGRTAPAIAGTLLFAAANLFWLLAAHGHPNYVAGVLPGLFIGGSGAGLTQAPLFATASVLPPERATTGSGVLNMARQLGSAIGVAILVTLLASAPAGSMTGYRHGWIMNLAAGVAAAIAIAVSGRSRRA